MLYNYAYQDILFEEDKFFLKILQKLKSSSLEPQELDEAENDILERWYWAVQVVYGDEYQHTRNSLLADGEFFFDAYYHLIITLAESGVPEAQYKLYLYNIKIEQLPAALHWLKKATENVHVLSLIELLHMYAEGNQIIEKNNKKATILAENFLQAIQREYSKALLIDAHREKSTFFYNLHERIVVYLKRINLPFNQNLILKKELRVKFLCDAELMTKAIQSLNDLLTTYPMHIDVNKSKWQLANACNSGQLIIDECKYLQLIRPMAMIHFNLIQTQKSMTDSYLYMILINMGITFRQLVHCDETSRICVLSIDDENVIKTIPTQCERLSTKLIENYQPTQSMSQPIGSEQEQPTKIDIVRQFLTKTKNVVDDTKWNDKAYSFFSYYVPDHIQNLRTEFSDFSDKLSDASILLLFDKIKTEVNSIKPIRTRDSEVSILYAKLKEEIDQFDHSYQIKSDLNHALY